MKVQRVELYFAMYITAIIAFFTVNELVERWKKKAEEREIILIEVIKSLVEIGDVFEWAEVKVESGVVSGKIRLNSSYRMRESLKTNLILRSLQNPYDTSVIKSNFILSYDSTEWYFSSNNLKKGVEYQLQLQTSENIKVAIAEKGKSIIKNKLLKIRSSKLDSAKVNIDSLVALIAKNIQSVATSIIPDYPNIIVIKDTLDSRTKPEIPFIDNTAIIIAGTKNNVITFTYGNINISVMRGAQIRIGNQNVSIRNVSNNTITCTLPTAFDVGTYDVSVSGIPNIQTMNAKLKAVKIVIETDNIFYEGDNIHANINTKGEAVSEIRWRILKDGAALKNGEGRGIKVQFANADRGMYEIDVTDESGNILANRNVEVRIPLAPEVVEFKIDSTKHIVAIVHVYGQRNGINKIVSGFLGTRSWDNKWEEGKMIESRKEYKFYSDIDPNDCNKNIMVMLKVEDKNGQQSREKKEKKNVKCD